MELDASGVKIFHEENLLEMAEFHALWEHVRDSGTESGELSEEFNLQVGGTQVTARTIRTDTSITRELESPDFSLKAAITVTRKQPLQDVVYKEGSPDDMKRLQRFLRPR